MEVPRASVVAMESAHLADDGENYNDGGKEVVHV